MQISKNNWFCLFALGSFHEKFDVSPWYQLLFLMICQFFVISLSQVNFKY